MATLFMKNKNTLEVNGGRNEKSPAHLPFVQVPPRTKDVTVGTTAGVHLVAQGHRKYYRHGVSNSCFSGSRPKVDSFWGIW